MSVTAQAKQPRRTQRLPSLKGWDNQVLTEIEEVTQTIMMASEQDLNVVGAAEGVKVSTQDALR